MLLQSSASVQYFVLRSLASSVLPKDSIVSAIVDHVGDGSILLSQICNISLRQLALSLPRSALILFNRPSSISSMMPMFSQLPATFVRSSVNRSLSLGFWLFKMVSMRMELDKYRCIMTSSAHEETIRYCNVVKVWPKKVLTSLVDVPLFPLLMVAVPEGMIVNML